MDVFLEIILIFGFLILYKKRAKCFLLLVLLQGFSYFMQFLVDNTCIYSTGKTFFNACFVNLNLFLIIMPWSYCRLENIYIKKIKYFCFFKRCLYWVLSTNFVINVLILIFILVYVPDITSFKTEHSYRNLYDSIPFFGLFFRYAYITQSFGYLAIPIVFYYLGRGEYKKCIWALILSCSSLISGFAFYSRAQIFTFVLMYFSSFLLLKNTLPINLQRRVESIFKKVILIIGGLFLLITIIRFSAMDYYGDRIPKGSVIKDPIVYSIVSYASQGYPNGLNQLENYSDDKNLKGEQSFYLVYQCLAFFGIISWDSEESIENISRAYDYDGGAFHGYVCDMVYDFGYILTLLISIIYCFYVKKKLYCKRSISLEQMFLLMVLLQIPVASIFYSILKLIWFFFALLFCIKILYILKK